MTAPNSSGDLDDVELGGGAKDDALRNIDLMTVSNAPNGGNVDLSCRLTNAAAPDGSVLERGTDIVAIEESGASQNVSVPPPLGTTP